MMSGTSSATIFATPNSWNALDVERSRRILSVYAKLAPDDESDTSTCDSDSTSLYDSVNEIETDEAKDESDYSDYSDDYVHDTNAELEYEVDDSSPIEDIESHNSSSGFDDELRPQSMASAITVSKIDSNDLGISAHDADMEESDGHGHSDGLVLRRIVFTKCTQCKSDTDNPQYPYCHKCYQVRKLRFAPRPKHRSKPSSLVSDQNSKASELGSTSSTIQSAIALDNNINFADGHKHSNTRFMERNSPSSPENVYPIETASEMDCSALKHSDSLASTVSAFTVSGLSSSSSSSSISDTVTSATMRTDTNTHQGTKRKFDSTCKSDDCDDTGSDMKQMKLAMDRTGSANDMCMICLSEPKNCAFVHNQVLHACCCYGCAKKVWIKIGRCPVCNLQIGAHKQIEFMRCASLILIH